ncbi:MAG: hypothetical protein J5856_00120 [Lachnospiraceae bacterium]|nr:hypothetical protein [Lachnospiraceae bacterium]
MKTGERIFGTVLSLVFVFLILFACKRNVSADMGAKPSINLKVLNAPEGEYYIAVLGKSKEAAEADSVLKVEGEINEESAMEYMKNFSYDGWSFYYNPVNGTFDSSNDKDEYYFGYSIPKTFRFAVLTSNGDVYLSNEYTKKEYRAECTYDFATGEITEEYSNNIGKRVIIVASCYIITLIVEMVVLAAFGFPFTKRNVICVLIVNAATNIPMNAFLVSVPTALPVLFFQPLCEAVIIGMESAVYSFVLRYKEGKTTPLKSFFYGIGANIISAFIDVAALIFIFLPKLTK